MQGMLLRVWAEQNHWLDTIMVTKRFSCLGRIHFVKIQGVQEECTIIRESVPYVKVHRYNPKRLYPKLNCY
jgi:hypothetical protein